MNVDKYTLYILVEGEPDSPEMPVLVEFIGRVLRNHLINFQVVDVGGSHNFRLFAQRIYRHSEFHKQKKIPVIALADRDYRTQRNVACHIKPTAMQKLIADEKPLILYWPRHEWENYLLEETDFMAAYLNHQKKRSPTAVTSAYLQEFLVPYFQNVCFQEYQACLKFHLSQLYQVERPSISIPRHIYTSRHWQTIQYWFYQKARALRHLEGKLKETPYYVFHALMEDLPWKVWLEARSPVDVNVAKQRFQGKEAFKALCIFAEQEFKIHNLKHEEFTNAVLQHLRDHAAPSAMFQDLERMLAPIVSLL